MNNMFYLAAAYGLFWLGIFAYTIKIQRDHRRLEQQIATLEAVVEDLRNEKE